MKKILLVLLGLVILAVSFSGCGGGGENKKDDGMVDLWVLVAEYYDVPEDKQDQLGERACLYAYEYDKNSNMTKMISYDTDMETVLESYSYEYDKNGNRIKETCYDSQGKVVSQTQTKFDKNGNVVSQDTNNAQ